MLGVIREKVLSSGTLYYKVYYRDRDRERDLRDETVNALQRGIVGRVPWCKQYTDPLPFTPPPPDYQSTMQLHAGRFNIQQIAVSASAHLGPS